MNKQNDSAAFEQFVSQLEIEYEGKYLPLQERLANKQKNGKTYPTCWLQNKKTEQRVLGVMKSKDHISIADAQEAKAFKFKKD